MKINPINNTYPQDQPVQIFQGKKNLQLSKMNKAVKSVFIPAAVFAAMIPSLVNAKNNEVNQESVRQEQVVNKDSNMPYYLQPEYILHKKDFKMNGEKYTMMYTDYCMQYTERDGAVSEIFFVPESYKLQKSGNEELNQPPKLLQLIKHNEDDGNYFVGAYISEITTDEKGNNKYVTKEVILPDEIGDELLDLYEGRSNLYLIPGVNTYTDSYSSELKPEKVQEGKKVLSL